MYSGAGIGYAAGSAYMSSNYARPSYSESQLYSPIQSQTSALSDYKSHIYNSAPAETIHSNIIVESFLAEDRPWTPVISQVGEVKEIIDETFQKITSHAFPWDSIKVVIASPAQIKSIHQSVGGSWSDGIMGFSFNKFGRGTSEIYIKEEHMDSLLLTIGHEIGHILSPTLPSIQDEEAKAHAFSIAWMETIRDNNIAGLQPNISLNPAKNGIHDVGYDFVKYLMRTGSSALDVFKTLSTGLASILARVEA